MAEPSTTELLHAAIEISEAASPIAMRYFRSGVAVEDKPDESPVTAADRETEEYLTRAILGRFPDHGIFGEEFGQTNASSSHVWVIDPIDGTKSFISGSPLFGMLLGVARQGEPLVGVIRMPALGETIAGARGAGSLANGRPVRCRSSVGLSEATIYLNEANQMIEREPERFDRLMRTGKLRRFSYDCYPFALLAMGHIDVVVDFDLQPYDYLPVVPVVEGAGGTITDWRGEPLGFASDGTVLAAGTQELHAAMLDLLR